jgi:hypothetical protein
MGGCSKGVEMNALVSLLALIVMEVENREILERGEILVAPGTMCL